MSSMKVGDLREHLAAAMASAMRRPEPEAVALTADRAKAMAVALAGLDPNTEVDPESLVVGTRIAAIILGFHPEHVRRLIRTGRLRATLVGGDYRVDLSDLWPFLEVRYRQPGRRRIQARR
jgi:excisionase family DNA binding protein